MCGSGDPPSRWCGRAGATQIATRMVREFGLSPALGPIGYASTNPHQLGPEVEDRAVRLVRDHRDALDRLAALLVEHETVNGTIVLDVLTRTATPVG